MTERRPLVLIDGTPRELPGGDTLPEDPTLLKEADIGSTVCSQTDSRLSDSREWTASTVTQVEAEAGTATTRRAWTAQRVFQAIAAWWNASAAKSKLDGIASGATANSTDAQLRDRSTHTGTQAVSTITGLGGAATLNVGTVAGTVCAGNDPRLSDARTPTSHTHGNITNAGAIGSTSGVPLITGTSGVIQAGSFGSSAGTFCQGNDVRLSDSRTPTAHTHTAANISDSTSAGRALLTATDAAAQRTSLGLGTAATTDSSEYATAAQGAKADTALQPSEPITLAEPLTVNGGVVVSSEAREGVTVANTGTAYTVDLTPGTLFDLTLTGNCTFTFPSATAGRQFTLVLTQDATGARAITWPSSVRWAGGSAPEITATANRTDVVAFLALGSVWLGVTAGQNWSRA